MKNFKATLISFALALSLPNTSYAIPDNTLAPYTAAATIFGGIAGAFITKKISSIFSSNSGTSDNATSFLLASAACGALCYLLLKNKTATARFNQASAKLNKVEEYPFLSLPTDDINTLPTDDINTLKTKRDEAQSLEDLIKNASGLLLNAQKDCSEKSLATNFTQLQTKVKLLNKKINIFRANIDYTEAFIIFESIKESTIANNERYVKNAQIINSTAQYPIVSACDALMKDLEESKKAAQLLNTALELLKSTNQEKDEEVTANRDKINDLKERLNQKEYNLFYQIQVLKNHINYKAEVERISADKLTKLKAENEEIRALTENKRCSTILLQVETERLKAKSLAVKNRKSTTKRQLKQ